MTTKKQLFETAGELVGDMIIQIQKRDATITDLRRKLEVAEKALEAIADPFPGKPYEGSNWPDLWKTLGGVAKQTLALLRDGKGDSDA